MDEEIINELMKKHTAILLRVAYYYTKNLHTAEDIVQDVFIKYFQKKRSLQGEAVEKYLMKMTVNKAKDHLKSWHYQKLRFQEKWFVGKKVMPVDQLVLQDEEDMISAAIFSLPVKQREVIAYYYLEGFNTKQVAQLLNIPDSTVKSRLVKGRNELKQKLEMVEWEVLKNEPL